MGASNLELALDEPLAAITPGQLDPPSSSREGRRCVSVTPWAPRRDPPASPRAATSVVATVADALCQPAADHSTLAGGGADSPACPPSPCGTRRSAVTRPTPEATTRAS